MRRPRRSDYPATYVNWNDAAEYCRKLTERSGLFGMRIDSPRKRNGNMPAGRHDEISLRRRYECGWAGMPGCHEYPRRARCTPTLWRQSVGTLGTCTTCMANVWEWCQNVFVNKLVGGRDPLVSREAGTESTGAGVGSTAGAAGRRFATGSMSGPVQRPGLPCRPEFDGLAGGARTEQTASRLVALDRGGQIEPRPPGSLSDGRRTLRAVRCCAQAAAKTTSRNRPLVVSASGMAPVSGRR